MGFSQLPNEHILGTGNPQNFPVISNNPFGEKKKCLLKLYKPGCGVQLRVFIFFSIAFSVILKFLESF